MTPGLPLTDALAATADPDAALEGLLRLAAALDEQTAGAGPEMLAEVADDEGTAMRLCSVLGASAALTHHLVRHPTHWRELTDPTLGSTRPAAYAVREAMLTAVGADPHAAEPVSALPDAEAVDVLRVEYRRILLRLAARDLAHHVGIDDAAAEISDLAAATLEAALAVARARVGETAARHPAGGHRDGQVRRPRAQLRLRRRRRLRPRAGRAGVGGARRRVRGAAGRDPARLAPDAGLLRPHTRGHHLAGRRQPATGGQPRPAGAHPRQPPRLLREVGEDLGVPGTAQGPARRR